MSAFASCTGFGDEGGRQTEDETSDPLHTLGWAFDVPAGGLSKTDQRDLKFILTDLRHAGLLAYVEEGWAPTYHVVRHPDHAARFEQFYWDVMAGLICPRSRLAWRPQPLGARGELTGKLDKRSVAVLPKFRATRGTRGTQRGQTRLPGRIGASAIGHFRVRARQLTPSAFNGSALLESRSALRLFLFRATRRRLLEGPTMPEEGFLGQIKRFVVGEPIPSHLAHHERLSRVTGLAVLSSDPLSSVAYATEEILRVLVLVNVGALTSRARSRSSSPRFSPSSSSPTARRFTPIRAVAAPTSSPERTSAKCPALIAAPLC